MAAFQLVYIRLRLDRFLTCGYNDFKGGAAMKDIMQRAAFTAEEQEFFTNLYQRLTLETLGMLDLLKEQFTNPESTERNAGLQVKQVLTRMAETAGIEPYSIHMLFVLLCAPQLPLIYRKHGLDESYAMQLLDDIRCKLTECENTKQVIGISTLEWFYPFFTLRRFPLGRFQYDLVDWELEQDYHFGDIHIQKGNRVYKIHIPSSGRMTREKRLESYREAHAFFGCRKGEPIVLFCRTWLLYDGYRACYPEGSNLRDFQDDFDMVQNFETDCFSDAWRIFNRDYDGDTSVLPCETTLQRNFIDYIENGGKFGIGSGVIIFDGEHILNNKRDNV